MGMKNRTYIYRWLRQQNHPQDPEAWTRILNAIQEIGDEVQNGARGPRVKARNRPVEDPDLEKDLGYTLHANNPTAHSGDLDVARKALLKAIVTTREEDDRRKIASALEVLGVA